MRARLASRQPLASRPAAGDQTCSRGVLRSSTPSPTHRPSVRLKPRPGPCDATGVRPPRKAAPPPGKRRRMATRHAPQRHRVLHAAEGEGGWGLGERRACARECSALGVPVSRPAAAAGPRSAPSQSPLAAESCAVAGRE